MGVPVTVGFVGSGDSFTHMSREMLARADSVPEERAHDGLVVSL